VPVASRRPRAEWLVIAGCAALSLALRGYQLTRPGYLFGVTEYDDGVLFGNAVRLAAGVIPYRDFAMVQPPGGMLLVAPVALLAKATGTAWGLAACRVLTVGADTADVVLLGLLVRHRGPVAALVACGGYAVYPDAIVAAHTFLLEPWLNLFCLAGARLIFDGDRMAGTAPPPPDGGGRPGLGDTRRLAWGGAAFGFAVAVKVWALVPFGIAVLVLVAGTRRVRPAAALGGGAALGLGLPLLPFGVLAPGALARDVLVGQAVRDAGGAGGLLPRLADLAGLSLLPGWLPQRIALLALAAVTAGGLAAAYLAVRRPFTAFDSYVLASAAAVTVMFLLPRLYYAHYGAFDGPFLALTAALAASALGGGLPAGRTRRNRAATTVLAAACGLVITTACWTHLRAEARQYGNQQPTAAARLIPAGACVLTNDAAYTVAANRFSAAGPGCPSMVDSFGTWFAMTSGRPGNAAGAAARPVAALWQAALEQAGYVWITSDSAEQIPWSPGLYAYFQRHFRLIGLSGPRWALRSVPRAGVYARI
jgi:alpha-1,2-mannosyltransferase